MDSYVLEVQNLTKKFKESFFKKDVFTAVDDLSFSIKDGEILGLLGKNGAGKTTTIQMLLGIMKPTKGDITYFGKELYKHRQAILKQVNFSSTYISMPWFFTVEEILQMYAMLYEVPDKKKRITKLTKEFEIDHLRKKQFYMLSAGEKTRLLLTKAFLNYPKLILLDEPTASLDVDVAVKIRDFLKKEQSEYNVSVLLTSHNMAEVEEMCNRVIIINNGKIVAHDTPENLAKKMKHSTLHLLIQEQKEKMEKLLEMKNMKHQHRNNQFSITIEEKEIADFLMLLAKEKIGYAEVTIDKPDLEDFFLEVVNS